MELCFVLVVLSILVSWFVTVDALCPFCVEGGGEVRVEGKGVLRTGETGGRFVCDKDDFSRKLSLLPYRFPAEFLYFARRRHRFPTVTATLQIVHGVRLPVQ